MSIEAILTISQDDKGVVRIRAQVDVEKEESIPGLLILHAMHAANEVLAKAAGIEPAKPVVTIEEAEEKAE